jgi:signal transduction histidine kinase
MGTWSDAGVQLAPLFAGRAFELRFALDGGAAVRTHGGPVAPRHAEALDAPAPWSAHARCGEAAGCLLATAAPTDPGRAQAVLERAVERYAALRLQALARDRAAMTAEVLESLTHRLRTDVSTLQIVAEAAATGVLEAAELAELPAELARTGAQAQERLSTARDVMRALAPFAPPEPEPLLEVLARELEAAGTPARIPEVAGERPMALVPGPGWAACARLLAGGELAVAAHPDGWAVSAGPLGDGEPVAWTEQRLGERFYAGLFVVAGGGSAGAVAPAGGGLRVNLVLPAAPSC